MTLPSHWVRQHAPFRWTSQLGNAQVADRVSARASASAGEAATAITLCLLDSVSLCAQSSLNPIA